MHLVVAIPIALGALLPGTAQAAPHDEALATWSKGRQATLVVYDRQAKREVLRFNPQQATVRLPACSTFKVPLSVMAFDHGTITESTPFKWDGAKHEIEGWNQDQTPATWMSRSVVWVSQLLTAQMGTPAVQKYLAGFDYGNRDLSGGLTTAWLPSGGKPTLQLSADEQIRFLDRLWSDSLPASKASMAITRKLMAQEPLPNGGAFSGKTGSGRVLDAKGQPTGRDIGWFVGHLRTPSGGDYVFAANFVDLEPGRTQGYGGPIIRQLCRDVLSTLPLK